MALTQSRRAKETRKRAVAIANGLVLRASDIHYAQTRPINYDFASALKRGSWTADCSGSTTSILKAAGAPDPNGRHYDGSGYTGTMLANLPHIPRRHARRGDLIVFDSSSDHVVMLLEPGWFPDPLVFSHGSEVGPLKLRLSVEHAYHSTATLVFLRAIPLRLT